MKRKLFCSLFIFSDEVVDSKDLWSMEEMKVSLPDTYFEARETALSKLLLVLSLNQYYPAKIVMSHIQEIKHKQELDEKSLPWSLLNKIVMLNYNAREEDLNSLFKKAISKNYDDSETDSDDGLFEDKTVNFINPMDLFYATYLCCHPILKQDIISKMYDCKLAIPFIYTDYNQQLTLSQWALRKILIDKRLDDKILQIDPLQHDIKIVSFLRIGSLSMSKSKIINEILHDKYHPTFFNRDCHLGTTSRKVADGIVEASWFIPSGRETDIFNDIIMVLNLRGDSMHYSMISEIVFKLSHAVVVHIDVEQLSSTHVRDALIAVHNYNIPVIYALEANDMSGKNPADIWKSYKASIKNYKTQIKVLNLKTSRQTKSSSDITKEMRCFIIDSLQDKSPLKLINLTKKISFADEKLIGECRQSKQLAGVVMKEIENLEPTEKASILPLQGRPWSTWCSDLKKMFKSMSDVEQDHLKSNMDLLRAEQVHNLDHIHKFMALFIHYLDFESNQNMEKTAFFLNWIKIYLDEKSRRVVPHLISKYQQCCLCLRTAVENHRINEVENLRMMVNKAEQGLVEATFGLEHLIRELGQIYEAVKSKSAYTNSSVEKFPKLVSKLIQCGYPLEIMNGDTASVPLLWVESVMGQLQKDLGDKKLLVISVLGIQSSGKSTLLNVMFGVQFAVSAGRCTKGVFAQLVKVQEGTLPYEYVLIIDTEGLRAPELGDQKQAHDNELATFVLGLGNITIINIKGENTQEMEDVLQIAVHAFLRLKMANSNIEMKRTCIFVHQNVPAVDAATKMIHARQKMMDKLDKLTCEAAKQEGIADINSFSQVIEVNQDTHMWYFSDLWSGDPPMAPINVGYSRNVQDVKRQLLFDLGGKRKTFLTISETTTRMRDLWYGILSDNFVFSFRNSLEVKAYHTMDDKFHKLMWDIELEMHRFVQKNANFQIVRCANNEILEKETSTLLNTLNSILQEQLQEKTNLWNKFIENCPLQEIMEQWRQNRILHLTENVNDLVRTGEKNIRKLEAQHAANLVSIEKRSVHESELRIKAEALASQFKEKSLSDGELEKMFNVTWDKWSSGAEHTNTPDKRSVEGEIKKVLFDLFKSDRSLVINELKRKEKAVYTEMNMLENSVSSSELKDKDISISQAWYKKILNSNSKVKKEQCKDHATNIINMLLGKIDNFIESVIYEDGQFENTHAKEVFMIIIESIKLHNAGIDDIHSFTFTAALRVKLAVHVSRYITIVFTNMDKRYEANHNIIAQIENYKISIWHYFRGVYKNIQDEITTANMLIRQLKNMVKGEIQKNLPLQVVNTIFTRHFSTKHSLMITVMKDLAKRNDFHSFYRYINDAENFTLKWVTKFTNVYMFATSGKSSSRYMVFVQNLIDKYLKEIEQSAILATSSYKSKKPRRATLFSSPKRIRWIQLFEVNLSKYLPIPLTAFSFLENQTGMDFENLHKCLVNQLKDIKSNLLEEFRDESKHPVMWKGENPCKTIFDKLWGCNVRCPFCKEVCEKTRRHTFENHSCIQHRVPGIVGVQKSESKIMSWESCNYKVHSNHTFTCGVADQQCQKFGECKGKGATGASHYYRDYKRLIPNWKIEPSPLMDSSAYWMWFVYTYRTNLSELYNYKVPKNVLKWGRITKKMAIESLQKPTFMLLS